MSRQKLPIDPEQVTQLAAIQCSYAEMAAVLNCNPSTLTRRFAQEIQKGREQGKCSLKRAQFKRAMDGSIPMLIWLGKQYLGQRENPADVPPPPPTGEKVRIRIEKVKEMLADEIAESNNGPGPG